MPAPTVADGRPRLDGSARRWRAASGIESGRGRFLHELLVPPLQRSSRARQRCTTLPCWSPSTWTSICRGRSRILARDRSGRPRTPPRASVRAWANAACERAGVAARPACRGRRRELEGAGAAVVDLAACLDATLADPRALPRRDVGRRRLLEYLLVATLQGTVALTQIDRVSVMVRKHLHLDVAGILEILLEVHRRVAERRLGLGPGDAYRALERRLGVHDAHAAPAAAARRLHDDRVADLPRDLEGSPSGARAAALRARHAGNAGLGHDMLGGHLVAHQPDGLRRRADEDETALLDALGKVRVLGEKPVAGVDRLGVGDLRRADDRGDIEVALARRRRADAHRLVGELHVLRLASRPRSGRPRS